jgi:hypothetical protein
MLRRPVVHLAALRFLRLAVPRLRHCPSCAGLVAAPVSPCRTTDGPGVFSAGCPIPALGVETTGPPRFLVGPSCVHALLFDPDGTSRTRPVCGTTVLPSALMTASAPITINLSGLYRTACMLAVYASQDGLPHTHARLASDCRPALPGGIHYPLGPHARFQRLLLWRHHRSPPSPSFAWRTIKILGVMRLSGGAKAPPKRN